VEKLYGLSIHLCVPAIAKGEIKESQVAMIITRAVFKTDVAFENCIEEHREWHWQNLGDDLPRQCTEIVTRLWLSGKIKQPALHKTLSKLPQYIIKKDLWLVEKEFEVQYPELFNAFVKKA
jgi:hypothetical protein